MGKVAKVLLWVFGVIGVLAIGAAAGAGITFAVMHGRGLNRTIILPHIDRDVPSIGMMGEGIGSAVVTEVTEGSPAEKAGLQVNDVITAVDDEDLTPADDLGEVIADHKPGDRITLTVLRLGTDGGNEEELELDAVLGAHPDDEATAYLGVKYRSAGVFRYGPSMMDEWLPGDDELPRGFHMMTVQGVPVEVAEDGPAAAAGLKTGDVILAVDGEEVSAPREVIAIIAAHKPGDRVTLTVLTSGEDEREVEVTLGSNPDDEDAAYLGVRAAGGVMFRRMGPGTRLDRQWQFRFDFPPEGELDRGGDL